MSKTGEFDSAVRKQLESSPNFDHMGGYYGENENHQENNSFYNLSKISRGKSVTQANSNHDSCLDILEPNSKAPIPHVNTKKVTSKSPQPNIYKYLEKSEITSSIVSSKINTGKEQTINSANEQSQASFKTNHMLNMLNYSKNNKSSAKNSFVTMGDDQIDNLRNMFFGKDEQHNYSSNDTEFEEDVQE